MPTPIHHFSHTSLAALPIDKLYDLHRPARLDERGVSNCLIDVDLNVSKEIRHWISGKAAYSHSKIALEEEAICSTDITY
jgi:hypothetical protein